MTGTTTERGFVWLIFVLAIGLRLALALVNLEANDQHFQVTDIIRTRGVLPTRADCWECFQPKLFHLTIAYLLDALAVESANAQIRVAQLVNAAAGVGTIVVVYRFLWRATLTTRTRLFGLAFAALNPRLVGINAQATNDSFVILFSTLALFYADLFFRRQQPKHFAWMTAAAVLSALSKGNGLVLFPAVAALFLIRLAAGGAPSPGSRGRSLLSLAVFCVVFLAIVAPGGQYADHYRRFGSPFVTNVDPAPLPALFEKTYVWRPGVTSIADSYFTFRIFDLIRQPTIGNDPDVYALHRTSLWSQLYGRANFVHFVQWPPSWRTDSEAVINIGRAIMVLALAPMMVFLVGAGAGVRRWLRAVWRGDRAFFASGADWVLDVCLLAYLGFIVAYTMRYRDYSCMKAVFVFPGLLCVVHAFGRGASVIYRRLEKRGRLVRLADVAFGALAMLYAVDVACLISQIHWSGN